MLLSVGRNLKSLWRPLVATDLLFKAVAFVLLTPIVGFLFQGFLYVSGRTVLADVDIARFLIHPTGWLALIVVGGASISVLALEQSVLMTLSLGMTHRQRVSVPGSFHFVFKKATGIFWVSALMVIRVLLLAVPFLVVGGGLYWLLLTKHDINYYLSQKPPQFWLAVVSIGAVLTVLAALLVRCVVSWSVAMQLHLFENVPPKECLKSSRQRISGHRKTINRWVLTWVLVNFLVSSLGSSLVLALGRIVVPGATGHLWLLVIAVGGILLLLSVVNLGISLLAVISFALMQAEVYDRFGRKADLELTGDSEIAPSWSLRWTRGRTVAAAILAVIVAGLVGITAIRSVRLEDDVEITAHRGASGKAPENTMASVRQAIADGTDWVEIDVQESKDGIVVVAHDSDLKKVSGVDTKIWEATAEELQTIDIGSYFGPKFKEERVPTLADVLAECRGKVGLNIELKYYGHDQNLEQKVVDLVEQHDMVSDVVIMSLESAGIQKIKQLRPDWTVGLLTAVAAGDLTRSNADFLAVSTSLASRSFIRNAADRDKQVYVWTVNDQITMSTMISRGAANLITDHPELARQVLEERAEMSPVERVVVELAYLFGAVSGGDLQQ